MPFSGPGKLMLGKIANMASLEFHPDALPETTTKELRECEILDTEITEEGYIIILQPRRISIYYESDFEEWKEKRIKLQYAFARISLISHSLESIQVNHYILF